MSYIYLKLCSLSFIILLGVFQDIRSFKIRNYTIIIGLTTGILFSVKEVGLKEIYIFLIAMIIPVIILFPLFLFKVLGAGDIKLFSVVGCYLGISTVIQVIIISFFTGAILSTFYIIRTKSLYKRISHFKEYISKIKEEYRESLTASKISITNLKIIPYYQKEEDKAEGVIHFSIAIFLAYIIMLIFHYFKSY